MMRVLTILVCAGAFGIVMGSTLTSMMIKDPVMADTPAPVTPVQVRVAQVVVAPHKNLHSVGLPLARATKISTKSIKAGPMLTSHHTSSAVARSAITQHD